MYVSTKSYGHEVGFSCAFRQWRAQSHCRFIHGYALKFRFEFEGKELDEKNWLVDFGGLKSLKGILENTFDHTTIIAEDDPELFVFQMLQERGLIQLRVLPAVGCEMFAKYVAGVADVWLDDNGYEERIRLRSVEVWEHGANSARFEPTY